AGSGDVLTGMITGLIAQGYEPLAAAMTGVFLHGMAGDLVAQKKGLEALTAGDMIDAIGQAYWILTEPPKPDPESDPPDKEKSK
ncbi:MAG: NAD(P)H-hydrate dehydratase, partial [Flavobacteriaceae bacterium]